MGRPGHQNLEFRRVGLHLLHLLSRYSIHLITGAGADDAPESPTGDGLLTLVMDGHGWRRNRTPIRSSHSSVRGGRQP